MIAVSLTIPLGHQAAPCHIDAFHPYGALQVVTVCSPFLVGQKGNTGNKRENGGGHTKELSNREPPSES
jgi:hypothetical protein